MGTQKLRLETFIMPWIKIDDQFADHPKIAEVGPLAGFLYVAGLCYCGRYLTDGFIPRGQVRKLIDVDDVTPLLTALVMAELWDECDGGYLVHDYLEYNPSGEQVKAERKAAAERQKTFRERRRQANGRLGRDASSNNGGSNAVTNGEVTTTPSPSPSPNTDTTEGADAPIPATFEQWRDGYRAAGNPNGYAGWMVQTLYPGYFKGEMKPNYGMLGKLLAEHDAEYVLSLFFQNSARPPVGDPIKFVQRIVSKEPGPAPKHETKRTRVKVVDRDTGEIVEREAIV